MTKDVVVETKNSMNVVDGKVTSLELVKEINMFRSDIEGKSKLLHNDLLKVIRDEFEEEIGEGEISPTSYTDKSNRQSRMFNLTISQAKQVLVRESRIVRKSVIKRLEELEVQHSYQISDPIERALVWIKEQQQAKLLLEQKQEQIEYKEEVITGLVEDVSIADMRTIFNRIVTMGQYTGETISQRYTNIYRIFKETHHVNLKARCEGYNKKQILKKNHLSVIAYAEHQGHMRQLYNICVKYYETDVKKVLKDLIKQSR